MIAHLGLGAEPSRIESQKALLVGLRWVVSLAVLRLFYRFGPNRVKSGLGIVTTGAVLVTLFWFGSSAGLSYFQSNAGNHTEVKCSIGAKIAMLNWLCITAFLVLMGAVLNVFPDGTDKPLLDKSHHYHDDAPKIGKLGDCRKPAVRGFAMDLT